MIFLAFSNMTTAINMATSQPLSKKTNKRNNRNNRKGGNRSGQQHLTEYLTFSIKNGSSTKITVSNLNRPSNRNFQPLSVHVHAQTAHTVANNDQGQTDFVPSALQIVLWSPTLPVASSPPIVLGSIPKLVKSNWPKASRFWFPYDQSPTTNLAVISAVCLGGHYPAINGYISGIASIRYRLGPEILSSTCPNYQHLTSDNNDDQGSIASTSSFAAIL